MPPSFSYSSQCRQDNARQEEGDNKRVGRKRTPSITNASDKAHHAQDTGVKGHGSFTTIVSRSSSLPTDSPPFPSSFLGCFRCRAASVQPGSGYRVRTRAGTTKGTARRHERRRQMTRGSCSLDRSHVTSSETSWTRFILSSLSESLSDISSLPPFPESLFLSLSLSEPVPRRVPLRTLPALTLLPSFNLFSCVACSHSFSLSLSCPAGATSNTRINHAQTFPRSGHARR